MDNNIYCGHRYQHVGFEQRTTEQLELELQDWRIGRRLCPCSRQVNHPSGVLTYKLFAIMR